VEEVTPSATQGDSAHAGAALSASEEPSVPSWCGALMEGSLWLTILLAALFSSILGRELIGWICLPLVALSVLMWALHWHYLRRSAFHVSLPLRVIIGAVIVVYVSAAVVRADWLSPLPDSSRWIGALLCLAVFVIVSGAFTETQLARLLGFLTFVGVIQVVLGLRLMGPGAHSLPVFGPLAGARGIAGAMGSEWVMGVFLVCCILAAATFAARSLAASLPAEGVVFHSRVTWITSAGVNTALIALVAVCLMLILLFLAESILIFPICMAAVIVFLLTLALKRKTGALMAAGLIATCLLLGLANLARPSGLKWGLSGAAFQSNVRSLVSLDSTRARDPRGTSDADAPSTPSAPGDDALSAPPRRKTLWPVAALLAALVAALLTSALRGVATFHENQPILAAGAFSTIVAVVLFMFLGTPLASLGAALPVSVACAVAAAGGDFEEELEEEE